MDFPNFGQPDDRYTDFKLLNKTTHPINHGFTILTTYPTTTEIEDSPPEYFNHEPTPKQTSDKNLSKKVQSTKGKKQKTPKEKAEKPKEKAEKPKEKAEKPKEKAEKPKEKTEKPKEKAEKPKEKAEKPKEKAEKPKEKAEKPKEKAENPKDTNPYIEAAQKGNESCRKIDKTQYDIKLPTKEGKYVTYIFSFEMLNTVLANLKGKPYSETKQSEIVYAMHSPSNIRMKNEEEFEGFSNDMKSDTTIMNALNSKNEEEKKLPNKMAANRLLSIWNTVQKIDLPDDLKQNVLKQFSNIKDKDGNDIIE